MGQKCLWESGGGKQAERHDQGRREKALAQIQNVWLEPEAGTELCGTEETTVFKAHFPSRQDQDLELYFRIMDSKALWGHQHERTLWGHQHERNHLGQRVHLACTHYLKDKKKLFLRVHMFPLVLIK